MTKKLHFGAAMLIALYFFAACIPLEKNSPDSPTNIDLNIWQKLATFPATDQNVRALHATPFELYTLSNSQFIRFDDKLNLLEKRPLPTDRRLYGAPVMSDNAFVRVYQNPDSRYVIEFRLARNNSVVKSIRSSELVDTVRSESFRIEEPILQMGCFSEDGTQFLLTGVLSPSLKVAAMIFDVQLDFNSANFTRVALAKRVVLDDVPTDGQIESIRHINGNFFMATKVGGYRISPNGLVYKLFPHWTKDFFFSNGRMYATAFNAYDFHLSYDNGQTWRRTFASDLQFVTNANNQIFSQKQPLEPHNLADSALTKTKTLIYNTEFKVNVADPSEFDVVFFKGKYFANNGKNVFWSQTLKTN